MSEDVRVEETAAAVRAARSTLQRWETEGDNARAELEDLESRMGAQVLDSPEAAADIARGLQQLRDRISLADAAAAEALPRILPAEQAYLEAEATAIETGALAEARAVLVKHTTRTLQLLADLEEHEGRYLLEHDVLLRQETFTPSGVVIYRPKSAPLVDQVQRLDQQVQILREMAAGRDPAPLIKKWDDPWNPFANYPDCVWGPDALVPMRVYVEQVRAAERALEEVDEALANLPAEAELRRQLWVDQGADPAVKPLLDARIAGRQDDVERYRALQEKQLTQLRARRAAGASA